MNIKDTAKEVFLAVAPIAALVILLQVTLARLPAEVFMKFIGGAVLVMLGLTLFLLGVNVGFLPIGEMIGSSLVTKGKLWLILVAGFVLGFVVTVAEPDVQVLAQQVDSVTNGSISKLAVVSFIALGVGIFVALALLRIFLDIPIKYLFIAGYILAFAVALFSVPEFVPVAFDSGGVTTGPMTVPFILALGVGVASVIGKKNASGDSFGLVGLASLGPILAVLLMGVFYR